MTLVRGLPTSYGSCEESFCVQVDFVFLSIPNKSLGHHNLFCRNAVLWDETTSRVLFRLSWSQRQGELSYKTGCLVDVACRSRSRAHFNFFISRFEALHQLNWRQHFRIEAFLQSLISCSSYTLWKRIKNFVLERGGSAVILRTGLIQYFIFRKEKWGK